MEFWSKITTNSPDSLKVAELLKLVGFNKVHLKNSKVIKENDSIYVDFNAIAKGYAVDVAGRFLESQNVENYLVEIGGEIRTRGEKPNEYTMESRNRRSKFLMVHALLKK